MSEHFRLPVTACIFIVLIGAACGHSPSVDADEDRTSSVRQPLTSSWQKSKLLTARVGHSLTPLADGRVLAVGGSGVDRVLSGFVHTAEIFDPSSLSWTLVRDPLFAHKGHSGIRLADGRVLIAGGSYVETATAVTETTTMEIFDPVKNVWTPTGPMPSAPSQSSHPTTTALTTLANGEVLAVDGSRGRVSIYNPLLNAWRPGASMNAKVNRLYSTATVLADNRILLAGGWHNLGSYMLNSAEIYDPATDRWSWTAPMSRPRAAHRAVRLKDGRVLVTGGTNGSGGDPPSCSWYPCAYASAELYDPATGTWSTAGSMTEPRMEHVATVLASGAVLVAGGIRDGNWQWRLRTAELFWPATKQWTKEPDMFADHWIAAEVNLVDGRVLIAGGRNGYYGNNATDAVDIYVPGDSPSSSSTSGSSTSGSSSGDDGTSSSTSGSSTSGSTASPPRAETGGGPLPERGPQTPAPHDGGGRAPEGRPPTTTETGNVDASVDDVLDAAGGPGASPDSPHDASAPITDASQPQPSAPAGDPTPKNPPDDSPRTSDVGGIVEGGGCSCRTSTGSRSLSWLWILPLVGAMSRRRSRREDGAQVLGIASRLGARSTATTDPGIG